MKFIDRAERVLEEPLSALPSLPDDTKKSLFAVAPWLVMAAGALQILAVYQLYEWASKYGDMVGVTNNIYQSIGGEPVASGFATWVWLAMVLLVAQVIILFAAFFKLRRAQKEGWDLLLLAIFINLAYGIVTLFIDGRGLEGGLAGSLVGTAVGLYLLFQVRGLYITKKTVPDKRSNKK